MSQASTVSPAADAPSRWGRAAGLSGLVMPAVLAAFSLYLLLGSLAMDTEGADFPGPDFFPLILAVAGLVIAATSVLFIGDAIFPGGNDYPAEQLGLDVVKVKNVDGTLAAIAGIVACLK